MKPFSQRWRDASDEAKDQPMEEPNDRLQAEVDKCGEAINHHIVMEDSLRKQITRLTAELDAAKDSLEKERAYRDSELDKAHQQISNLRAELDAVRKESSALANRLLEENLRHFVAESAAYDRGRSHELTEGDWLEVEKQRDAAQARNAELEKLIQDAPHGHDCALGQPVTRFGRPPGTRGDMPCTCWKSRLSPAPPEEKRP